MIVCGKPCVVYDVDVIGFAAIAAIGLAACYGVVLPATAGASQYGVLTAQIASAKARTQETNDRLCEANTAIATLEKGVAERTRAAPKPGALTAFMRRVASLAQEFGLQIEQVVPQPAQRAAGYRFAGVHYVARGTSLDFARFLDQLARETPYFVLREFSLRATESGTASGCRIDWTLRLYMLDDEPAERLEGQE